MLVFLADSPPKPCMLFSFHSYVLHAPLIQFFLIGSAKKILSPNIFIITIVSIIQFGTYVSDLCADKYRWAYDGRKKHEAV
jgi:hypothetical protein